MTWLEWLLLPFALLGAFAAYWLFRTGYALWTGKW